MNCPDFPECLDSPDSPDPSDSPDSPISLDSPDSFHSLHCSDPQIRNCWMSVDGLVFVVVDKGVYWGYCWYWRHLLLFCFVYNGSLKLDQQRGFRRSLRWRDVTLTSCSTGRSRDGRSSLCFAFTWATREYLNLSAGFAGDDRGRGKYFFLWQWSLCAVDIRTTSNTNHCKFSAFMSRRCH